MSACDSNLKSFLSVWRIPTDVIGWGKDFTERKRIDNHHYLKKKRRDFYQTLHVQSSSEIDFL